MYALLVLTSHAHKADDLFTSVLRSETSDTPGQSSPAAGSPVNRPLRHTRSLSLPRRQLFTFNTSSSQPRSPLQTIDTTSSDIYNTRNVSTQGQLLLDAPRLIPRTIPKVPYRVLDAPGLADDYYLGVIDWSSTNILAAGLANSIYLLNTPTQKVTQLCNLNALFNDSVGSVSWAPRVSLVPLC